MDVDFEDWGHQPQILLVHKATIVSDDIFVIRLRQKLAFGLEGLEPDSCPVQIDGLEGTEGGLFGHWICVLALEHGSGCSYAYHGE